MSTTSAVIPLPPTFAAAAIAPHDGQQSPLLCSLELQRCCRHRPFCSLPPLPQGPLPQPHLLCTLREHRLLGADCLGTELCAQHPALHLGPQQSVKAVNDMAAAAAAG